MMELRFSAQRYSVMFAVGYELDSIGELNEVEVPRNNGEDDQTYRDRLIIKLDWLCGSGKAVEPLNMDDFLKYREWLQKSTPVEIDGLRYFVQCVSFENGRTGAWLVPCAPVQFIGREWHGPTNGGKTTSPPDDNKQNHVRDAVRANP